MITLPSGNRVKVTCFKKPALLEWAIILLMLGLCALLVTLQYRWTGEVARAEQERLESDVALRAEAMARAFDGELGASCERLVSLVGNSLRANDPVSGADLSSLRQAMTAGPPIGRVALVEAQAEGLRLCVFNPAAGRFIEGPWPGGWTKLRDQLEGASRGGRPPADFGDGFLLEFPLFLMDSGAGGHDAEVEEEHGNARWLIVELDRDEVRDRWLPGLAAAHLGPALDWEIRGTGAAGASLRIAATLHGPPDKGVATVAFHRSGRMGAWSALPSRGGEPLWRLAAWPRPGVLEKTVSDSRRRNLLIGAALACLILAAAGALFFHTRQSRRLAEARMRLIATMSHELRTPLTIICGAAHNLETGRIPGNRTAEYAAMIRRHGDQLRQLVEQVLDFSHSDRKRMPLRMEPLASGEFIESALASARQLPEMESTAIHSRIPDDLPAVMGDAPALRRVLLNLLHNALHHGAGASPVELVATEAARGLQITVSDRGPGIPPRELRRIFEVFFRGSRALENQTRGSGIGLSVVKEIVDAHGGRITADNRPGGGATFTLWLPSNPA
jgi:signal transduction histidine kinase